MKHLIPNISSLFSQVKKSITKKAEESIELAIYFSSEEISTRSIIDYFEKVHRSLYNSSFKEISYSIKVKNHLKGKSLKYTDRNIEKLTTDSLVNGFSLFSLLANWEYKSIDIEFLVSYQPNKCFNQNSSLNITINRTNFYRTHDNDKLTTIYLDIVNFLKANSASIVYGFVFSIANKKFPALFTSGIGSNTLKAEETEKVQVWAENERRSDSAVWDIFWGNLITANHLIKKEYLKNIKEIVGDENFYVIDEFTYFFRLMDDNLTFGTENRPTKNKLLEFVNKL